MQSSLFGFKKFVFEEMDPSTEKSRDMAMGDKHQDKPETMDYFGALEDEENIAWHDLVSVFESEPWISAHFGLGKPNKEIMYKLAPWEIVKGSLTPHGADIRLKPQDKTRSYLQGNRRNKSDYQDNKRYHLNREELIKFLTTGWTPAAQAQQGAGGMPGM